VPDGLEVVLELVDEGNAGGMLRPTISSSETPSRYFTRARRLFPWAAITTRRPARTSGAMRSCQ
jgi:hypothetical protein